MRLTSISGPVLPEVELPLWPPILATHGAGSLSALHAHHALHLVLCLDGTLRARTRPTARWAFAAGVLTGPNVLHAIDAEGVDILLIFFDPQSDAGEALLPALQAPVRLLSRRERDLLVRDAQPERIMGTDGVEWTRQVVATLGGAPIASRRHVHPRVRKLLRILRTMPADEDRSLVALASSAARASRTRCGFRGRGPHGSDVSSNVWCFTVLAAAAPHASASWFKRADRARRIHCP